jgi:hypothetical protein
MTLAALKSDDTSADVDYDVERVLRPTPDFSAVSNLFRDRIGQSLSAEKQERLKLAMETPLARDC